MNAGHAVPKRKEAAQVSAYDSERERAMQLLNNVPDSRLVYVIGFLEGAAIPEEKDPFYSSENMSRLKRSIAQMEATGGTVHEVRFDDESLVG